MKTLTMALLVCGLCVASAGFAQTPDAKQPGMAVQQQGAITNYLVVDPDLTRQTQVLTALRQAPASQDDMIIPWITNNARNLPPAFLYELSRRLWNRQRSQEAFEWYALGGLRARYDAARCIDKTAPQGIAYLPALASDVSTGIQQQRAEYGRAGLRALERTDLLSSTVSPWWICSHGIDAAIAASEKRQMDKARWLKPESEWDALRTAIVQQSKTYFEEQGKPQNDPIPLIPGHYKATTILKANVNGFAWLDAERLVIGGYQRTINPPGQETVLKLWRSGEPLKELARFQGAWCAGNGVISYRQKTEKLEQATRITFMTGQPEHLQPLVLDIQGNLRYPRMAYDTSRMTGSTTEPLRQSPFDCRWVRSETLSGKDKSSEWLPLQQNHGFLVFIDYNGVPLEKLMFVANPSAQAVALPVPAQSILMESVRYFPFKNAYFMSPLVSRSGNGAAIPACRAVWWLYPESGRVEEICVPTDSLDAHGYLYTPSKVGMLRSTTYRHTPHGELPGGIYLLTPDGQSEKIYEAPVQSISVSPDGCRVAISEYPTTLRAPDNEPPFSILELCSGHAAAR